MEWGVYCENFVMIGLTADAGDNFKNRASIPVNRSCRHMNVEARTEAIPFMDIFFQIFRIVSLQCIRDNWYEFLVMEAWPDVVVKLKKMRKVL